MCPEVRELKPGACPSCGMALEPDVPIASTRTEYTCPMHPQIVRPAPGSCPICGMALEPRTVTAKQEENPELRDMTRRFWVAVVLTAPLLVIAMGSMLSSTFMHHDRSEPQRPADQSAAIRIPPRHPRRPLVRPPILPALLDVAGQPQPQHVHADRPRHRRRLHL